MKKINITKTYAKRTLAMFLAVLSILGIMNFAAPIEADAASYNNYYFPKYSGYSGSIVTGLNSVGVNSSYSYRSKIAVANGISGYRGTASQNTSMLNLLKQGRLINPDYKASTNNNTGVCFPRYTGYSGSIVTGLNSVGVDSSYAYRSKIAAANGISGYRGTASQNTSMLNLLKQGRLIRPDALYTSGNTDLKISYYDTTVNTTLRSEPYEASSIVVSVPKNTTVMVSHKVTNNYGNLWYKAFVYCKEGVKEGYIYSGKVTSHAHSHKAFEFNEVTYNVCCCGAVKVSAKSAAKVVEGNNAVVASTTALPMVLGLVDGPLPIGDLIGAGILVVGVCLAHDILTPSTAALAEMITEIDFDEYLKKRKDNCNVNSFRKVMRVGGKLKYIDTYCMDIVEAYIYCRFLGGNVYTVNENNALLLAAMHGRVTQMHRDKDMTTYYYHYHLCEDTDPSIKWTKHIGGHVFFGTNDYGEMPF